MTQLVGNHSLISLSLDNLPGPCKRKFLSAELFVESRQLDMTLLSSDLFWITLFWKVFLPFSFCVGIILPNTIHFVQGHSKLRRILAPPALMPAPSCLVCLCSSSRMQWKSLRDNRNGLHWFSERSCWYSDGDGGTRWKEEKGSICDSLWGLKAGRGASQKVQERLLWGRLEDKFGDLLAPSLHHTLIQKEAWKQ